MMKHVGDMKRLLTLSVFVTVLLPFASLASAANPVPLRQRLQETLDCLVRVCEATDRHTNAVEWQRELASLPPAGR